MKDLCVRLIRGIIVLLSKLPLKFHYFMGDILSWIAKNVIQYRSNVVLINIVQEVEQERNSYCDEFT